MPSDLTALEFRLDDVIGGKSLTPETVDLPTLRGFLEEIEKLIKGDVPGASLADSRVEIKEGSLKVAALVGHLLAADVTAELTRLENTGDLDSIQPKRAEVIEQWMNRARRTPARTYCIAALGIQPLKINNTSQFQHGSENAWVAVEKYLTGKVVDLGGKQKPNVHLVLAESGKSVSVDATEQQLANEKENQLYKFVTLRVQAEEHLKTKELRDLRLVEFLPQSPEVDEAALTKLWEKGRTAWKEVRSAAGWVEVMRGNQ